MSDKKTIDVRTVEHIAGLARIYLTEEEIDLYRSQLADILDYIHKLKETDTSNILPTSHPLENLKNVFRKDEVKQSLSLSSVLQNAPKKKDNYFSVPKIIE